MLRGAPRVTLYGSYLIGLALLTSCGGTKTTTAGTTPTKGTYVGVAVCQGCHADIATTWQTTLHSSALKVLEDIGQGNNKACLPCHTVGYGKASGFVNKTETPGLANVQCEMCHGPGSAHVAAPGANPLPTSVQNGTIAAIKSDTCGQCHTGTHNPQYDEWSQAATNNVAGHSRSLSPIQSRPTATNECIECHSGERFIQVLAESQKGRQTPNTPPQPQGVTATTNVECWVCHAPHEKKANTIHQLREPVSQLCATCHTFHQNQNAGSVVPPSLLSATTPRHGQIFFGDTGIKPDATFMKTGDTITKPDGSTGTVTNSAHTTATKNACADCHVYTVTVAQPTTGSPNITGHTFTANLKSCTQTGCHATTTRDVIGESTADPAIVALYHNTQAAVQARLDTLAHYFDKNDALYINRAKLNAANQKLYDIAKWDRDEVTTDSSLGIHNLKYTNALLDVAQSILQALPQVK